MSPTQKCDGLKPICTPCGRSNRDECKYTDKNPSSRKQVLEGKISRLEARLRDLESNGRQRSNSDAVSSTSSSYLAPSSAASSSQPPTRSGVASSVFEPSDTMTLQQCSLWTSSSSPSVYSSGFAASSPSPSPEEANFSWFGPAPGLTQEADIIAGEESNQLYAPRADLYSSSSLALTMVFQAQRMAFASVPVGLHHRPHRILLFTV